MFFALVSGTEGNFSFMTFDLIFKLLILGWLITTMLTLIWLVKYFIWNRKQRIEKKYTQKKDQRKILKD